MSGNRVLSTGKLEVSVARSEWGVKAILSTRLGLEFGSGRDPGCRTVDVEVSGTV